MQTSHNHSPNQCMLRTQWNKKTGNKSIVHNWKKAFCTTPLPPTHRKYHPPSYNTHTPTILQHSYTKGTPTPLPPTHRKYHPPSYNTHTLKGPLPPPPTHRRSHPPSYNTHTPTILQHSYTKGTHHPPPPYPQLTGSTSHHLTTLIH